MILIEVDEGLAREPDPCGSGLPYKLQFASRFMQFRSRRVSDGLFYHPGVRMDHFAKSITEAVRHPLLIVDCGLMVVKANHPFHQLFGTTPGEVEGRRLFDIDESRWDQPQLRTLPENLLAPDGYGVEFEMDYDSAIGGVRKLAICARRVVRDDGIAMVLLAIEDKTESCRNRDDLMQSNTVLQRRILERTIELETSNRHLLDVNRQLAASNRELEAFCYSVSHDLRAPLRAIDGFSQELSLSYNDLLDQQAQHYLSRIRHGAQRMGHLIDDLLKLSRVTRATMEREWVDITAVAEIIAADLAQQFPKRTIVFTAHPGLTAWGDPQLIQIMLENLLGNAWKFTARIENPTIEFGRSQRGFFVRDNGAGFDPIFVDKLFGAFQRLHSERDFPGTGIGLATVQRIVHRHGGEIHAEGAVGQGATFSFRLPGEQEQQ